MKRLSRFSAIILAIMLALASISRDHGVPLLKTIVQDAEGEYHTPYFSEKNLNDVYSTHRPSELVVNPVNSLPVPGSKIQAGDFLGASFSLELRVQAIVSDYLAYAKRVCPSLRVAVIIFPFHYFW